MSESLSSEVMAKPLAIDLFTGLHGWAEGLVAEGWRVVGFDIEDMCAQFGMVRPKHVQLVLQNVLTIHGRQFKDAALIVASPPCQEFSYMAMPWSRAKQKAKDYETGVLDRADLTRLFDACFRIQREACEAAGRHIPLVVENVRGAQRWVGRARWNFGSFYLWGDVPALMPIVRKSVKVSTMGAGWYPPGHPKHVPGLGFNTHAARVFKTVGHANKRDGHSHTRHLTNPLESEGLKQGGDWFGDSTPGALRSHSSKSSARKMASAMIAKIPLLLSRHIAATWRPA